MAKAVVEDTRTLATAALKKGHKLYGVTQAPSKWAAAAGHEGSDAGPLRQHIARDSDNGCGRQGRYPKVDAEGMIELIELGDQFAEAEGTKQASIAKRISSKVRPAAATGAKSAKVRAKTTRKRSTKTAA